jgi:hypothetical protein
LGGSACKSQNIGSHSRSTLANAHLACPPSAGSRLPLAGEKLAHHPSLVAAGIMLILVSTLAACASPRATAETIRVQVAADGETASISLPSGSTVQAALEAAGITLGDLDRVQPASYTVLDEGALVQIQRVTERFEIETTTIPFERQTIRNEGIPQGETILLQPGSNGTQETTYRVVMEEGEPVSRTPVKTTMLDEPKAEIIMIGSQAWYAPLEIEGRLAYVSTGNAWLMQESTGNRLPLVSSGDLDGRAFKLSPDGGWLLYSRAELENDDIINTLWLSSTRDLGLNPIDLKAQNVIHFAAWSPDPSELIIAYSTAEISPSPPGWQANNDLWMIAFDPIERRYFKRELIPSNAGGQYGWWGSAFTWSPDGSKLAYARADSIGIVRLDDPAFEQLLEIAPYQTLGDWAWVPGVAWGRDNETLYFVDHGEPIGLEGRMASPVFDLAARPGLGGNLLSLASRTGMFASPSVSGVGVESWEAGYRIAYLQAITPLRSENSRYRLVVIDRDGSNRRVLFPPDGEAGIEPQHVVWSPDGERIALTVRGDLWIVDVASGQAQQITGEGQTAAFDWGP